MEIKRDRQTEYDIAQVIRALHEIDNKLCPRFESCIECPLGKLGVLDTCTCDEIKKLAKRLDLAYKVVETL